MIADASTRTDQNIAAQKGILMTDLRLPLDEWKLDLIRAFPPLAGTVGVHFPSGVGRLLDVR
jgi:hypothetical protein